MEFEVKRERERERERDKPILQVGPSKVRGQSQTEPSIPAKHSPPLRQGFVTQGSAKTNEWIVSMSENQCKRAKSEPRTVKVNDPPTQEAVRIEYPNIADDQGPISIWIMQQS